MKGRPSQDYADLIGDGVVLRFDFGQYSSGYLKKAKKPAYVIAHESIGGFPAKIASPMTVPLENLEMFERMGVSFPT